jgi:hypothetical protein
VQSGAGNTVVPAATALSSLGTVIQNSVNGQKIQSMTIVNATVNSMQVMKSMNLQATIRDAVTRALGR